MSGKTEKIRAAMDRFKAMDDSYWFLITDDDDRVLVEGRPASFVSAFMSLAPPTEDKPCHYHVAWIRIPPGRGDG